MNFEIIRQLFPPKPLWTADDMPDLSGKVTIVTGGNAGVGKETVKALLQHGAKVYLAARSAEKAEEAIQDLKAATGKEALFLQLDLADLRAVRRSAEEFLSKETELHVLFNNAGIMATPMSMLTAQNYDAQIGTNVLGHYFFTTLLLPALKSASTPDAKARVVTTSSSAAYVASGFSFECTKDGPARQASGPTRQYNESKLGNVLVARELARRHGDTLVSIAVNPGNLATTLNQHMPRWITFFFDTLLTYPVPMGAITQLWAGVAPETAGFNGKFLIPWARVGPTPNLAQDAVLAEKLWAWLEEQCRDY